MPTLSRLPSDRLQLLEDVRTCLRDFHGIDEEDGLIYLRCLAKSLYDLTIAWAKVSCKQVVDLKLLSCRLQEYSLVRLSQCDSGAPICSLLPLSLSSA